MAAKRRRLAGRAGGSEYDRLAAERDSGATDLHIDHVLAGAPAIIRLRRRAKELAEELRAACRDERILRRYFDLQNDLAGERERLLFDEVFRRGRLAGRIEGRRSSRLERQVARRMVDAAIAVDAPDALTFGGALEAVRCLALEIARVAESGNRPGSQRRPRGRKEIKRTT